MPNISQRGIDMPASPIRKLAPFAVAAKQKGIKVYHLNIGQPDIATPQEGLDALKNIDRKVLEYSPSQGYQSYLDKLVGYYGRYDIKLDASNIIVTCGGSEALQFAFLSCFNPGDELIVPEPVYANYMGFANEMGVKVRTITTKIENSYALPSIEEFEKLITDRTRAIMICNPNNPTGTLYSDEELLQLRDLVKKHDLYLISDEVYREFRYNDKPYLSALHLFAQARLSPPLIGQVVAEASLAAPQAYHQGVYDEYIARRNCLVEGLNKIPGVFAPMPMGAFYAMAKLPVEDCDDFCRWCLEEFSYEGETVMMAPATGFYATPGAGKNEVRMAYVLKIEDLKRALVVLEKALEAYNAR